MWRRTLPLVTARRMRRAVNLAVNSSRRALPLIANNAAQRNYTVLRKPAFDVAQGSRKPTLMGAWTNQRRSIFIQTESTPNPQSLKFIPGQVVLEEQFGSGMFFQVGDKRTLMQSPLAKKLFLIDGVKGVFLGRDFITITKEVDYAWPSMKPQVFAKIMDCLAEEVPAYTAEPEVSDTTVLDEDSEVVAMVKELLESKVRPAVQEDGGDIFFAGYDEDTGVVKVRLAGSCSGCPSSSITLRSGVENMLKHYIPEVTSIEEVEEDDLTRLNQAEADLLEEEITVQEKA